MILLTPEILYMSVEDMHFLRCEFATLISPSDIVCKVPIR